MCLWNKSYFDLSITTHATRWSQRSTDSLGNSPPLGTKGHGVGWLQVKSCRPNFTLDLGTSIGVLLELRLS